MLMGDFYLKFTSEYLRESCDCLLCSYVASWWAVCPFCFWYRLKGISSWNNLINIIFFLFGFFFLLDWLSSLSLFSASDDGQTFVKLLFQLPGNRVLKKRDSLWTEELSQAHTSNVMPPSEWSEGHMRLCFPCSCDHAVLDFAFIISVLYWILLSLCIEMLQQNRNKPRPLSFAFSSAFVLSWFSLPLLVQPWKFFC